MSENKEEVKIEIPERSSEQACREIQTLCQVLNARTTELKYTQQGVGKKMEMVPTGTWERSLLSQNEKMYVHTAIMALVSAYIEKGELVKFKEDTKKEETSEPEAKMEVVKEDITENTTE